MYFSLFLCEDGTFVVVPLGFAPPIEASLLHGDCCHVGDRCRSRRDAPAWDDISSVIDHMLYAVVQPDLARRIFEVSDMASCGAAGGQTA